MINQRQNTKENLDLLRAMRIAYDYKKIFTNLTAFFSVIIPFISILLTILFEYNVIQVNYSYTITIISLIWLLFYFILEYFESHYNSIGAIIQEKFDENVFDLVGNSYLKSKSVSLETIQKLSKKSKEKENKLLNWYTGIETGNHIADILVCQRSSIMWGAGLKKGYLKIIVILSSFYMLFTILIGLALDMSFNQFLLLVFLPSIPLFLNGLGAIKNLLDQIDKQTLVGDAIAESLINNKGINKQTAQNVQDFIFIFTRLQSVNIPNWYYKISRNIDDKNAEEINRSLSTRYKNLNKK